MVPQMMSGWVAPFTLKLGIKLADVDTCWSAGSRIANGNYTNKFAFLTHTLGLMRQHKWRCINVGAIFRPAGDFESNFLGKGRSQDTKATANTTEVRHKDMHKYSGTQRLCAPFCNGLF